MNRQSEASSPKLEIRVRPSRFTQVREHANDHILKKIIFDKYLFFSNI